MAEPVSFQDFRRPRPAAPPPEATSPRPSFPGPGALPLPPGKALRLTPAEAAALPRLGWQPGDPVPGNLADVVAEHADSVRDVRGIYPVPLDTPPVELDPIRLDDLPPEKQRELTASVRDLIARHKAADAARAGAGDQPLPPGVQEAIDLGAKLAAERTAKVTGNLTGVPPIATPPGGNPFDNLRALADEVARRKAQEAGAAPPTPPTPPPPQAADQATAPDSGLARPDCPHCGWQLDRPDEIEPGPSDKYQFLAMILGGPAGRFRKEVSLFDGALVVTFRTLTAVEADLPWQQLAADIAAGKHANGMDRLAAIQTYRLALTLDAVEWRGGGLVRVPEPKDVEAKPPDPTPLPDLVAWINASVLPQEHLRRAVEQAFFRFQRLGEKLEANAENPSFYAGIGSPP